MPRAFLCLVVWLLQTTALAQTPGWEITPHPPHLAGLPFSVTLRALTADGSVAADYTGSVEMTCLDDAGEPIADAGFTLTFAPGCGGIARRDDLVLQHTGHVRLRTAGDEAGLRVLPGWLAIAPPLLAIFVAIAFRQVVIALLLGVLAGAFLVSGLSPFAMLATTMDPLIIGAVADHDHAAIIVFSLLLGGLVGVISRSGGTQGIVDCLTGFARTHRSAQIATAGLGTAIFFDDYANCLIVGNTMRPLTDRLRISREKLAYIVDSTAAPVASLVPISTWVGFQVGQVQEGIDKVAGYAGTAAYPLVLEAIPYMFYPILALLLVFLVTAFGRDAFAMLRAERRALEQGKLLRDGARPMAAGEEDESIRAKPGVPARLLNALLPILAVIAVTVFGLIYTGIAAGAVTDQGLARAVREVLGSANSYQALAWAAMSGLALAGVLALTQRLLSLDEVIDAALNGMKAMLLAMIILILSWSLNEVSSGLHSNLYLIDLAQRLDIQAPWLPLLVFLLAAFTSLSTGTAWGTMGILMPLVVPLAVQMSTGSGDAHTILVASIGAVLGGAVFGDHCSPISDTTVLSSTASACDHVDHVRTQMPYALLGAAIAILTGYVPLAFGAPIWITLPAGITMLIACVRLLFRPVDTGPKPDGLLPSAS